MRYESPEPRFENLENSHLLVLDYLHDKAQKEPLYAFDPEHPNAFDRAQGTGLLRLAESGHVQIKDGNSLKVVKLLPEPLKSRLQLDAQSVQRLQAHRAELAQRKAKAQSYIPPQQTLESPHNFEQGPFTYNVAEARRLGLEQLEIPAAPEAQRLIEKVIDRTIDISTPQGQEQFVRAWVSALPEIPPPCVPNEVLWNELYPGTPYPININQEQGHFWYLLQLQSDKIISNLEGAPVPVSPQCATAETILIDSWEETDSNAPDAATRLTSQLLKELLGEASTVNIKREDLDAALWQGDPTDRIPTDKHKALLQRLGVDPSQYELRSIRQDEYARLAKSKAWGQKVLWTQFDHYFLEVDGGRIGLVGGFRDDGGASNVGNDWRVLAEDSVSVRLVLSRKQR